MSESVIGTLSISLLYLGTITDIILGKINRSIEEMGHSLYNFNEEITYSTPFKSQQAYSI